MLLYKIDDDISLRLLNVSDAEEFFELISHSKDYLKKWLGWLDNTNTVEDSREFIRFTLKGLIENEGYPKSLAIIYKGEIAGTISFNDINKSHKIGVIGYWLGEAFQRKGIMSKALKAMVDYGFNELDLNKIEIRVAEENRKSRALPEKLGFKKEGQIREAEWLYDHYVDHIVYGMLIGEWNQGL